MSNMTSEDVANAFARLVEYETLDWDAVCRLQNRAEEEHDLTWNEVVGIQNDTDCEIIEALRDLYFAGHWVLEDVDPGLPADLAKEQQIALWRRVKDLTGWSTKDPKAGR